MSDCIFCSIVAGEISASVVLDRDSVIAFRDIAPAAPTHVLVIPKDHVEDARAVGPEHGAVLVEMMRAAEEVARAEGITESGYRLVLNVGPDAGQTVFHLHMHVVGGRPLGGVVGA